MPSDPIFLNQLFRDQSLVGGDFRGLVLAHSTFERVDLRDADFRGAHLGQVSFVDCLLDGACFHYAFLEGARFVSCQLEGADFRWCHPPHSRDDRTKEEEQCGAQIQFLIADSYLYEIYYWKGPNTQASPLIALHGMTGHALDFTELIKRTGRPCFAINMIGHGLSGMEELVSTPEFDDEEPCEAPKYMDVVEQVRQVICQLMEHEVSVNSSSFDLIGYSMGGRLALHLALHMKGKLLLADRREVILGKLLLIGTSLGISDEEERKARRVKDQMWIDSLWHEETVENFLKAWNKQPLLARLAEHQPVVADQLYQRRLVHLPRGLAIAFECLGQGEMPPLSSRLSNLPCPSIWIYGEEDSRYREIAHEAVKSAPDAEAIEIAGTGHAPHLEDVDAFWDRVGDLINT